MRVEVEEGGREGGRGRTQGDIVPHCGCSQLSCYEAVSVVSSPQFSISRTERLARLGPRSSLNKFSPSRYR